MNSDKKEHVVNFIKAMESIEEQIKPYQQHKRDLRQDYADNNYLSKQEQWQAIKAWRFVQKGKDLDIDNFNDMYDAIMEEYEKQ